MVEREQYHKSWSDALLIRVLEESLCRRSFLNDMIDLIIASSISN